MEAIAQYGTKADLEKAVDILYKQLGGENPHFHYVPRRPTGVSDAEVHALLAYALAATGFLALGGRVLAEPDVKKMELDIIDEQAITASTMTMDTGDSVELLVDPAHIGAQRALADVER